MFLSYLWGMETIFVFLFWDSSYSSYPTYEEWKLYHSYTSLKNIWVLILPMRNGNQFPWFPYQTPPFVLILPMRNGNTSISFFSLDLQLGSYPTYEEWKQKRWEVKTPHPENVLILPMRNGNLRCCSLNI